MEEQLSFGQIKKKNNRLNLLIDVTTCTTDQQRKVIEVINKLAGSKRVNRDVQKNTEEQTLVAAKTFLQNLVEDETSWPLLPFYSELFTYINETEHLLFNGTGTRGFSVRVNILGRGEISLCTIWGNKTIEFSLKR